MSITRPHGIPARQVFTTACLILSAAVYVSATGRALAVADLALQACGDQFPNLDSDAVGEWWKPEQVERGKNKGLPQEPRLLVPRDQVMAFALYTHAHGVLKLLAQRKETNGDTALWGHVANGW